MAVIVIEDWMIEKSGLKGLDLLAFALIHGCTQKGDGCWYGGYDRLAQRIGGKQRGTIDAVARLVEEGLIEKFDAEIEGKKRKALRSLMYSAENAEEICGKCRGDSAENAEDNKINKNNTSSLDAIERIYKLYPSKCPVKSRRTGKSKTDYKNIARELKKFGEERLTAIIKRYVEECVSTQTPIKNLQTFLNHVPDYEEGGDLFGGKKWGVEGELYSLDEIQSALTQSEISHFPIEIKRQLINGGMVTFRNGKIALPDSHD